MVKRLKALTVLALLIMLSGCNFSINEKDSTNQGVVDFTITKVEYEAKATDFEEGGFENNRGQRVFIENGELILSGSGPYDPTTTSAIDLVFRAQGYEIQPIHQAYQNTEISTKGDTYHITADNGVSLKFKKIGQRIIVDEEGEEYFTKNYSK